MYSRYQRTEYDPSDEDEITDVSDDEYELYRYNLPPRYDGSRFTTRTSYHKTVESAPSRNQLTEAEHSVNTEDKCEPPTDTEANVKASVISRTNLSDRGYEDLLIISIILLIAEKGNNTGDVILLLILLLAAR